MQTNYFSLTLLEAMRSKSMSSMALIFFCIFGVLATALQPARRTDLEPGAAFRILPLGDSITSGFRSSDGNGYRLDLANLLSGTNLTYLGSIKSGTMSNNANEGLGGATINQIASIAKSAFSQKPSIVLLHAGTNDMNDFPPKNPYSTAPERLGSLIDEVVKACPTAAVLVAQIINAASKQTEARIKTFNAAIPGIVAERADAGKHVLVVDMQSVTSHYLADGLHPNDAGYEIMAEHWYEGLQTVVSKRWINGSMVHNQSPSMSGASTSSASTSGTSTSSVLTRTTSSASTRTTSVASTRTMTGTSATPTSGACSRHLANLGDSRTTVDPWGQGLKVLEMLPMFTLWQSLAVTVFLPALLHTQDI